MQLDSVLLLPGLILPQSELSSSIQSQSIWSGQSLESLLDEILKDTQAAIEVQDHIKQNLNEFTITKMCKEVRIDFVFHQKIEDVLGTLWKFVAGFPASKYLGLLRMVLIFTIGKLQTLTILI